MRSFRKYTLLTAACSVLIFGCSPTKRLSKGEYLLTKNIIQKSYPEKNNKAFLDKLENNELENYIKQKPNTKMMGVLRFHLMMHNFATRKKRRNKDSTGTDISTQIDKKIKKIVGEPPVIVDSLLNELSSKQIALYLKNKGYFNAKVQDSIVYKTKLKKKGGGKARVYYSIEMGHRFMVNKISYSIEDSYIAELISSDSANSTLTKGIYYDADVLNKERSRINKYLKNEGYYFFSKDYIYYEADSSIGNNNVNITLGIRNFQKYYGPDSTVITNHQRYWIRNIFIETEYEPTRPPTKLDTIPFKDYYFLSGGPKFHKLDRNHFIKYQTITRKVFIKKDHLFKADDLDNSYKQLSGLQLFKFINIVFTPVENSNQLDCYIQLSPVPKQSLSIETEGTNSSGNLGIAGNLVYRNSNALKGAELLEMRFKGAFEAQKTFASDQDLGVDPLEVFNTFEIGPETKLYIPKLLFPVKAEKIPKRYNPKTVFTSAYNYQKRQDYSRSITNITFGYQWKESIYKTHILNPMELSSVYIYKNSPILNTLDSIKNDFIRNSFIDHFSTAIRYSFIYNNQQMGKARNFSYFRGNIEISGNVLRAINNASGATPDSTGSYTVFNIPYAQYARIDLDYRYYNMINQHSTLVFRIAAGMGLPYGNSSVMPFEKSFFAGGSNGIRAWQARELGPGSYNGPTNYDQIADLKLEGNIESRLEIISIVEGAAFIDVGNIWLTQEDNDRPGAEIENDFLNEIAIGAGLGIRLNFNFFIIRLDAGFPVKDPSEDMGQRWVVEKAGLNDIKYNLGIGYPF